MKHFLFFALVAFTLTSAATGQMTWFPDKAHSAVKFSVAHMVVAEVEGAFKDFDVTVTATKDDFSDMSVHATVKTASVDTENEKRDAHLRSDDFFNSEKFPVMSFKSTKVEKSGDATFKITGDLTIRDVTKPVVLDARLNGTIKDPWGTTRSGFRATTVVKRSDFNVKWNKAIETGGFVVSDEVTVTLLLELQKEA